MRTYAVVYLGALLLGLGLTPLVVRLATVIGLIDRPDARKVHSDSIPRVGGIAIVLPMLAMSIAVLVLNNNVGRAFKEIQAEVLTLLLASTFMFLVGLVDDIRGLRAWTKFGAQIVAASAVVWSGIRIDAIQIGGGDPIRFGLFAIPLTLVWIVGITNAVNLIDGLDGLAAGIASITCALIAAFAIYAREPVMAVLMLALLGSLNGFLVFNFNPARIFMGDGGSLFLGFVLATASVLTPHKAATLVGLAMPMLALGVPIFDTLFSMTRRLLGRRSMFAPDQGHIHHRLLEMGLNQRHAVIVLYGITLAAGGLGVAMTLVKDEHTIILFVLALVMLLLVFRFTGVVQLRDSLSSLKRNRAIARETRREQRVYEQAHNSLRRAEKLEDWWQGLSQAGRELGVRSMTLTVVRAADGLRRTMTWHAPLPPQDRDSPMSVRMPVHESVHHLDMTLEAEVRVNGSLESGNRRLALIGRLIDEHGPHELLPSSEEEEIVIESGPEVIDASGVLPAPLPIMQFPVIPFETYDHAVDCIGELIALRHKSFCVATNPEKVHRAEKDPALRRALAKADIAICDGVGISIASRILHGRHIPRVTGVDLFLKLIERAAASGWGVYLLGASEEANSAATESLLAEHPSLRIVGRQNGYFKESDEVVRAINEAQPDLLFVAMGSPKQEIWISHHRDALDVPFCMGVGGTYDVVSGRVKRAPKFWQAMGLEFLYRLVKEPKRWRRQIGLPLFLMTMFKNRVQGPRASLGSR